MRRRLPEGVLLRKKAGFNVPKGRWFKEGLRPFVMDHLAPARVRAVGVLDDAVVSNSRALRRAGRLELLRPVSAYAGALVGAVPQPSSHGRTCGSVTAGKGVSGTGMDETDRRADTLNDAAPRAGARPSPRGDGCSRFGTCAGLPFRLVLFDQAWLPRFGWTTLEEERLRAVWPYLRGRILDVGAGPNTLMIRYGDGVGVDTHDWGGGAQLIEDAARLPFADSSFDTVTFLASLNHIPNRAAALVEARRLVRPGWRSSSR